MTNSRLTFKQVKDIANNYDLILERVGKTYELTCNETGVTDVSTSLQEVLVTIGGLVVARDIYREKHE